MEVNPETVLETVSIASTIEPDVAPIKSIAYVSELFLELFQALAWRNKTMFQLGSIYDGWL